MSLLRPELEVLPARMRKLPIDKRGYPVPWFVAYVNGEPEFRAMDGDKWVDAVKNHKCWVCGDILGKFKTFVIGPMCAITLTTSEPPSHFECAVWSAHNCPFLTQRQIKYREDDFTKGCPIAGIPIKRQPGVACLWTTGSYKTFKDGKGGMLIEIGIPFHVNWFSHARRATRAEVIESVESGFPILEEMAISESKVALDDLLKRKAAVERLYPA